MSSLDFSPEEMGLFALLVNAGCAPDHVGYALEELKANGGEVMYQLLQERVKAAVDVALVKASSA